MLSLTRRLETTTTTNESDDIIEEIAHSKRVDIFRGAEVDVLRRYAEAAKQAECRIIIRLTGDCPLIDTGLLEEMVEIFKKEELDYMCNNNPPSYPDGLDIEIIDYEQLMECDDKAETKYDREHVTPWIRSNSTKWSNKRSPIDYSDLRWTVDEQEDYEVIKNVVDHFGRGDFKWDEVIELNAKRPDLFDNNKYIKRNEGSTICEGQKIWRRAKRVIPGGNMLLSKRPEMFLPGNWPAYYSKAKGCKVWTVEGEELIDVSIMGIGTNILGYGHEEIDQEILKTVSTGNMCTLNCVEEVLLAEKLIQLHSWADMVRFSRSGGEANAIAVRIARAATGKDVVAICGYHGWHDWYLATNLESEEGLNNHLLSGLKPNGVPKGLEGTVKPFSYNNIEQLKVIVRDNEVAAVKMEVERNHKPQQGFLEEVRRICTANNIVLIFDECTSGFRETNGGLHLKYGIQPDMAMFGKALGNGYAITAVIGKREVMEAAQRTFISSTFWTERIGPTAGLKTLEVMNREKSWETVTSVGELVRKGWRDIASNNKLEIDVYGIKALSNFRILDDNELAWKTYITQEMLKRGYLASTSFYACTEHSSEILDGYLNNLSEVFGEITKHLEREQNPCDLLDDEICHGGFKRLN